MGIDVYTKKLFLRFYLRNRIEESIFDAMLSVENRYSAICQGHIEAEEERKHRVRVLSVDSKDKVFVLVGGQK